MKNPYKTLGLSASATQDEIKAAYRKLAKKHHPDLNPTNKANEERFKEISAAYDLLENPEKRAKFDSGELDEQSAYSQPQGRTYRGFEGMDEDIFSSLFGGARGRRSAFSMPGEDQVFKLEVAFIESILGSEKKITLPNGKSLQTKIPPGVVSGQKLRLQGQGGAGMGGAPAGDLYLELMVQPSEFFRRNENNIETSLPVSLSQALLGAELSVATVDGSVVLKIPPHSNTGTKLRIRGKGVPYNKGRGDHIVELKVMLPAQPDAELDAFVKEWSSRQASS